MASITPEELAALFKRRGHFDSTRKSLLTDFQNSSVGQQFASQLTDILQKCIDDDPTLLQREKPEFHQLMVDRITKSAEYKDVQQFVDSLLQPAQYLNKIEGTLMTIVKEQTPPEKETSVEQDKGKDHKTSRKSKDSTTVDVSSKPEAAHSSSRRSDTHGSTEKHSKQFTTVKKELSLELPPRPHSKPKDHKPIQDAAVPAVKREASSSAASLEVSADLPRKTSSGNGSREESNRKIIPKKRNRRQSVDSNSSLSSPPSSSEGESDASGVKAGNRAKKLAKKAPRDIRDTRDSTESDLKLREQEHSTLNGNDTLDSIGMMAGIESDVAMDVDPKPDVEGDKSEKDFTAAKQDGTVEDSTSMAVDQKEESSAVSKSTKDNIDSAVGPAPSKGGKEDSTADANLKSPAASTNPLVSRSSPSSSAPSSQTNSPAPSGTGSHRRRESETAERRNSEHHSSQSKRTGHQPLPLPPRPNIVPLPPKPAPLSLHRRTSHSRNSSSTTATTTGVSASTAGSASSPSLPTIPSVGSPTTSNTTSRQNSVTRERPSLDRHDSRSGHSHLHHPLPPPPHLQHPLPPPPRGSLVGSRSQSLSSVSKAAESTSPSSASSPTVPPKPVISTSQSTIVGSPSSHATPIATTPKSATLMTSPDAALSKNSPKAESHSGVTKTDHALKSPDSNASTGSIHSAGSLSSTGSLSTAGSVSELSMVGTSPDLTTERSTLASPIATSATVASTSLSKLSPPAEAAELELTKEASSPTLAKTLVDEATSKPETNAATPPPPPPPEPPVASSDPVPPPPPPPPSSPPPPSPSSESTSTTTAAATGTTTGTHPTSTTPTANSLPVTKSSSPLSSPTATTTATTAVKHSPLNGSLASTLLSTKSKSFSRTPIPLPHKPIPLPPRPNAPPSSTASSLKKKHK
ncbi:hypothetical protein BG015_007426 [Linnemannia schmuckeri]|uniref:BOD1/SHG1 domain-containing protein n=1 Tax=Linnemannia schmuckeri TaxID=64567 RepID=A0A9P5RYH4_9FUNG|nr:hypothetical protein BG015_007426 [Linnemannia schmuckeri]